MLTAAAEMGVSCDSQSDTTNPVVPEGASNDPAGAPYSQQPLARNGSSSSVARVDAISNKRIDDATVSRTLNGVEVTATDIDELFRMYAKLTWRLYALLTRR